MTMDLDVHRAGICEGDAEAFADFLALAELPLRESLRSFARVLDLEAVVQEAALRLWQVAPRFVPDGKENGLLRLLLRIGRNLAIDEVRRRHREAPAPEDLPDVAAPSAPPDPLLRNAVEDCMERLPEQPRRAMTARIENGGADPDAFVATNCAMRVNTFLQNVTRARKLLAQCLEKKGVELEGVFR